MIGYPRDLVGYADQPPDPRWPGGARLALNFVVNYARSPSIGGASTWRAERKDAIIGVVLVNLWRDCDPGIAETTQEAVDALVRAGAVACDFKLPEAEASYDVFLSGGLSAIELRSFLDRELPEWLDQLDPVIAPAIRSAESLSALDYLARVARLADLARAAAARLDTVDVIASPTLCLTPPLMSEVADADSHLRVNRRIVRNTAWVNYLGLCAITMPVGRDRAGMPVGLQLTAPARAEEKLLTIALAVERLLGTRADRLGTPALLAA